MPGAGGGGGESEFNGDRGSLSESSVVMVALQG